MALRTRLNLSLRPVLEIRCCRIQTISAILNRFDVILRSLSDYFLDDRRPGRSGIGDFVVVPPLADCECRFGLRFFRSTMGSSSCTRSNISLSALTMDLCRIGQAIALSEVKDDFPKVFETRCGDGGTGNSESFLSDETLSLTKYVSIKPFPFT